jgi:hypothetical protein
MKPAHVVGFVIAFLLLIALMISGSSLGVLAGIVALLFAVVATVRKSNQAEDDQVIRNMTKAVDALAQRMVSTLKAELGQDVEIVDIEDTGAAVEIDLLIGNSMLDAYQERAIVPYARLKDIAYWKQITAILINNYRARPAQPAAAPGFKMRKLSSNRGELRQ